MSLLKDFRDFAVKGNVVDLAVGIVIGTAFSGIVNSLVQDIVMPGIGLLTNDINFRDKVLVLRPEMNGMPANLLSYGKFLQAVINFSIIAVVMFGFMRLLAALKRLKEKEEKETPQAAPPEQVMLLREIRDLLKDLKGEQRIDTSDAV